MSTPGTGSGTGKALAIAIVVAAVVGGIAGFGTAYVMTQKPAHAPQTWDYLVFTVVLPFNDTPTTPHDYFAPDRITVYRGDTVHVTFYNTEDAAEDHTFTMAAPYEMNHIVHAGENIEFDITANTAGIYPYWCAYHLPTMKGYLVVLEP